MTWRAELTKVRRSLRDPDANIWSDQMLTHLWNEVQHDLQLKTSVLEGVKAQRIPDLYHFSYHHDWEWAYLPDEFTEFYQANEKHGDTTFTHRWEPQQLAGIEQSFITRTTVSGGGGSGGGYLPPGYLPPGYLPPGYLPGTGGSGGGSTTVTTLSTSGSVDVVDDGAHFTQPWEAFVEAPGEEVRMKLPSDLGSMKYIAYDEEPISLTTKKMVQSADPSHIRRTGRPIAYYMHESEDRSFVLYPRPSVAFTSDVKGDGMAFFSVDDTETETKGTIAVRSDSSEAGLGASADVIDIQDNVLLIYGKTPTEMQSFNDEPDFPPFMQKYVRYGVLARAYEANTDGRIVSLARLWRQRYELGVKFIKQFMRSRKTDRDYRFVTQGSPVSRVRRRHARLPDTYPAA